MRERKYVKFRVDMYADTKFKIIDMKPERDVIHYIWNRIVLLAGKVNLEGDLYFSKSIPYTIETLAIEFNRDLTQVKLALDLLIELEMVELSEDKIYRVKNFAKHQGITVKEKEISNNRTIENRAENASDAKEINLEIANKDTTKVDENIEDEKSRATKQGDVPIMLKNKKGARINKSKKDEIIAVIDIDGKTKDNSITSTYEGMPTLKDDQRSIREWSFWGGS